MSLLATFARAGLKVTKKAQSVSRASRSSARARQTRGALDACEKGGEEDGVEAEVEHAAEPEHRGREMSFKNALG
jgi:hypothetical protein